MNDVTDFRVNLQAELAEKGCTLWVRRRGRCSECGMWLAHGGARHGKLGAVTCTGRPKGRRRYRTWIELRGKWYPAGVFPEFTTTILDLESRARESREDIVYELPASMVSA